MTATRTPTSIDAVGSSVSVISAGDLERQQIRYVSDALQNVPGISVSQYGPRGTSSSVRLRGQGAEGTLVLIDGIEVSDPSEPQTAFSFSHLAAAGIGRVEVLRGSQSVLYGGDAVGGVVSVTTQRGFGAPNGAVSLETGRYGSRTLSANVAGGARNDRLSYNLVAQHLDTDGFSAADERLRGNTEADPYDNSSFNGLVSYAATQAIDLGAAFRIAEGTLSYDACGGAFCDDPGLGDDYEQHSARVSAAFHPKGGKLEAELGLAHTSNVRRGFDDGAPSGDYVGERHKVDFQAALDLRGDNTFVFGTEIEQESMTTSSSGRRETRIDGYYALYQVSPASSLHLSFGGRLDDHETFGSFDTYRATAAYGFGSSGVRLKASYSTGFRAPSLFELFGVGFGESVGNVALQPERSDSRDLGIEKSSSDERRRVGITYFEIDTRNDILFDAGTFGNGDAPNYFNAGSTRSKGIELSGAWLVGDAVSVSLAYTYTDAADGEGVRLPNRPRHLLAANADLEIADGRGNLNFNLQRSADTTDTDFGAFPTRAVALEDFMLLNVAASYFVTPRTKLNVRVENLFDERYQTQLGYGTAGRSVYAGISYRF